MTVLLKRAAELYSSLPDNPLEQYKKRLETISNAEIEKTEAERLNVFNGFLLTAKN